MSQSPEGSTPRQQLVRHVAGRLHRLQASYLSGHGTGSADLAHLRQFDPCSPGGDPAVYGLIFDDLPDGLRGRSDEASRGELAVAAGLHLFAVHQQGKGTAMYQPKVSFPSAVRKLGVSLGRNGELNQRIVERLHLLIRTSSPSARSNHVRGLVRQMRSEGIGFDHAWLAADLYDLSSQSTASGVTLRWARSLHTATPEEARIDPASTGPDHPNSTTETE